MTEESQPPTEAEPTESEELPRDDKGRFLPKKKVEPLYSKRNPEDTAETGTYTNTIKGYRDLLLEQIEVELPEEFESKPLRRQIEILEILRKTSTTKPTAPDEPKAQPLDKTAKPKVGGEVPAPTTVHVPSLLEKNRADIFVRQIREKTGYTQYRDKWKQAKK